MPEEHNHPGQHNPEQFQPQTPDMQSSESDENNSHSDTDDRSTPIEDREPIVPRDEEGQFVENPGARSDTEVNADEVESHHIPTPKEVVDELSDFSSSEMVLLAIRQIYLLAEPRIAEMPPDLKCLPRGKWYYNGFYHSAVSGTFDGRKLELKTAGPDEQLIGKADGEELSEDESHELFNDLYPVAVKYVEMQKSIKSIKQKLDDEDKQKEHQQQNLLEEASIQAHTEGVKLGKIIGLLEGRLHDLDVNEEDKAFLIDIIQQIAELETKKAGDYGVYEFEKELRGSLIVMKKQTRGARDDEARLNEKIYDRRRGSLYRILGVDEERAKKMVGGTINAFYTSDFEHETIIPDIIIRESFDRLKLNYGDDKDGAMIIIERNSNYQKMEKTNEKEI